jgi:hypothetical protein
MTSIDPGYDRAASRATATAGVALLAAFIAAIFTSAFLLFAVQPMFTKMVLPLLGGSPAVWSVAMVFFQSLLLAGYAYAHFSTKYLTLRQSALVHLALFAVTALALPIGISASLGDPPATGQEFWLIGVFFASVGLPFFAVSANGPLLQAWFARSGHATAGDPYYLYGASNLGSFAALLLYPVLIEPLLSLKGQTGGWSLGFAVLGALIAVSALLAARGAQAAGDRPAVVEFSAPPTVRRMLPWIALSFVPSGLLVAVTAHISTDVAASPFLWVVPLALYLATFVVVFRDRPPVNIEAIERILPIIAAALLVFLFLGAEILSVSMLIHFGFMTLATLVCHAKLYSLRPAAAHLTTFYLCMSFGGVLGGLFCGLIAPNIFNSIAEYPILIVAVFLCMSGVHGATRDQWIRQAAPWLIGLTLVHWIVGGQPQLLTGLAKNLFVGLLLAAVGVAVILYRQPLIAGAICAGLFPMMGSLSLNTRDEYVTRSFFGVHKVQITNDGQYRNLAHGTTLHGSMKIKDLNGGPLPYRPDPLSYYHKTSPLPEAVRSIQQRSLGAGRSFGVVGLGAGSMVCHGRAQDSWTFYEIDPAVIKIAQDPAYFRFLSVCAPEARMVLGDARLTLARDSTLYDALLIDAFASDAIPIHLLTREAVAMYLSRTKSDGLLVLHISNRHLDLESVVAAIAADLKVNARVKLDVVAKDEHLTSGKAGSHVVALSRSAEALAPLEAAGWRTIVATRSATWTDDYSNVVGAMWRKAMQ